MFESEKKDIDNFLVDISCIEKLEHLYDKPNIFDVLRITNNEIRHSNILAWLLDANQNHELGNSFFLEIVKLILKKNPKKYRIDRWMLADFSKERVIREWHKETRRNDGKSKKNFLDILVAFSYKKDDGLILAIENKVDSSEGENQTKRYHDAIDKSYPKYEKMLLFLSPEGAEPKDPEWKIITYSEIHDILKNLVSTKCISNDARKIIDDYIEVLERDIMKNDEMIALCTEIYKKHKNALDIIFKYKEDDSAILADFIKNCLLELSNDPENDIFYDGKFDSGVTYIRFSSKYLDKLLPDSKENNTWNNHKRYFFVLQVKDFKTNQKCPISLLLIMDNYLNQGNTKNTEQIIFTLSKSTKRRPGNQFCSLEKEDDILMNCKSFSADDVPGSVSIPDFKDELKIELSRYVTNIEQKLISRFTQSN